jgi:methylase of polypeptide subunit release factors
MSGLTTTSKIAVAEASIPSKVRLRDFYRTAADIYIPTRPNLFLPDEWARIFATGLQKLPQKPRFTKGRVLEVGPGTGLNDAGMLTMEGGPEEVIASDICSEAVHATNRVGQEHGLRLTAVQSDLLTDIDNHTLSTIDHIVACIPQVPAPGTIVLTDRDNFAHYYTPKGKTSYWDHIGLGLNAGLLEQSTERAPQAAITLNLSGRPGINRLLHFFERHRRPAEVLYSEMVPQHHGTSLQSLAEKEIKGTEPFEFFKDIEGQQQIGAQEAEKRRLANEPLFHKVYVMHTPGLER